MALVARTVLEDCNIALSLLEEEKDLRVWRIHWVAALALVRAVGHVLHKVDAKNRIAKKTINSAYQTWKANENHQIFNDFINRERNNILKEYQFNLHPNEFVEVAAVLNLVESDSGQTSQLADFFPIGENIYRPILDGYREGDDARDVYADAIEWWDQELSKIEASIENKYPHTS